MFKFIFQRISKLKKKFGIFIKIEKVLEKFQHAENDFENLNKQWEKFKEGEKQNCDGEKQI
jgi:uncharacterized protein YabN with tetrapyrrole methylase and pyrophosphatase domain